MLNTYKWPFHS